MTRKYDPGECAHADATDADEECIDCGTILIEGPIYTSEGHRFDAAGVFLCTADGTHSDDIYHALAAANAALTIPEIAALVPNANR
jgi:hypothetical protein